MLNRRELIAAFLGTAVACAARKDDPAIPPGELAGTSHEVGHRLRSAMSRTPDRWESHDVVIVGAGIAGLAAAWRLHGHRDALVLELEPEVGGTSRSGASRVSAFPWAAHYVPAPTPDNAILVRLLQQMGVMNGDTVGEEFLCRDPQERLFYRGRWYEGLYLRAGASDEDLRQLRAFEQEIAKWAAWRDAKGRRAFAIPVALGSDDAEVTALDRISMVQWMDDRGFTSPRLRWFVEYACRDDYGTLLRETSAWAGIFYYAARNDEQPFITWPEGNGRIVKHLARYAKTETGTLVARIDSRADGADVIAMRGDEVVGIRATKVIFAAPQFVRNRVISSSPAGDGFSYSAWMIANLTLRDRPASHGFPLAWDNVLYDSPSLGYVVATHQRGIDYGPTVFSYYLPLVDRAHLLAAGREEWADVALTDLSRAHPELRSLTERVDVMRWGHAMIRPSPGFVWSRARLDASRPVGAVHFANTDLSGVALVEEALWHGVRAAEEVLA